MYYDIEVTPEKQEEIINKIAKTINKYGLDMAAILLIESVGPMSFIGAQMGRLFFSPFLLAISEDVGISGEELFQIMEKRENVKKLIQAIEKLRQEEEERKKIEEAKKLDGKSSEAETEEASTKKGWRRFISFKQLFKL